MELIKKCNESTYNKRVPDLKCILPLAHGTKHMDLSGVMWSHPKYPEGITKRTPSNSGEPTHPKWWYEVGIEPHKPNSKYPEENYLIVRKLGRG